MSSSRSLVPGQLLCRLILFGAAGSAAFAQIGNTLTVSPTALSFSSQLSAPQPQQTNTVSVSSTVSGVAFSVASATSSGGTWLSAYTYNPSYTTANTPQTVTVVVNVSGIQATGIYNGAVTVTAAGATNSPVTIPVTFTVTANTNLLNVSPTSLSFSSQLSAPQPQQTNTVSVSSTVSGVAFSVASATSSGGTWLSAYTYNPSYTTANTPQTVTIVVNVSGIQATGTYNGAVTVTAAGATNSPVTIPVTFTVTANTNLLTVSPTSLTFSSQLSAPQPQQTNTVSVSSTVSGVAFSVASATSSGGTWLSAYTYNPSYTTANTPQTVTVVVNVSGIQSTGTYTGAVTVTAAGATNSPVTIPVTFTVTANTNLLNVSPTSLSFSSQLSAPQPQQTNTVSVSSTVSGVAFSVASATSSGGTWLSAYTYNPSYTTANTPQTVTIVVNVSGIQAAGTYNGAVTVTAAGATNSPVTIPVTFTVTANTNLLTVSPTSLSFSSQLSAPQPQQTNTVSVSSTVSGVAFSVASATSSGGTWLSAYTYNPSYTTANTPQTVTVVVNVSGIQSTGTYTGAVTVTAAGATNSPVTIPVTFTVTANTNLLNVSPTSLSFSSQLSAPQPQQTNTVSVSSTVSGVAFSVASATSLGGTWLSAYTYNPSYTTANTPQTVTVVVNVSGIQAMGTYNGAVTVTAAGATNSPVTIPVTFTVTANTNLLTVSPAALSFSSQLSAPQPQQSIPVSVSSTVSGVAFSVASATSSGGTWLSAYTYNPSYTTGITPQTVTVVVNVAGIQAAGTYNGAVTVTAAEAINSPVTIPVTFTVGGNTSTGTLLSVWPSSLKFRYTPGSIEPASQSLAIASAQDPLSYAVAVATGSSWLSLSNATGTTPGSVAVSVNAAALAAGTYNGSITVTATGAANSPIAIPVLLSVGKGLPGELITIAGTGVPGFSGDAGAAIAAQVDYVYATATDLLGNVYFADTANHRVRRIDSTGQIVTLAGTGTEGSAGLGGSGVSAQLSFPRGVTTDSQGNLYIADSGNYRVLKLSANETLTLYAGSGTDGYAGDGGQAVSAQMRMPRGLALDAHGNLYVADSWSFRVRMVGPNGVITTFAGTGRNGYAGDGGPATAADLGFIQDVAIDNRTNTIYISDLLNSVVRAVDIGTGMIRTVAGTGAEGFSGDGGSATSAQLYFPRGLAVDALDNLYIADSFNNRLRKVDASGTIATVAGTSTAGYSGDFLPALQSAMDHPYGLAVDPVGNLSTSDLVNYMVRELLTASPIPAAALNIAENHTGNFIQGQNGETYSVTVANSTGVGPTVGTVTMTETVPAGLTLVSMAGTGWMCASGGTTCTRSDSLAGGDSYPTITVTVNVSSSAAASVTNQVGVSGGGSATASATDVTSILAPCHVIGSAASTITDVQLSINEALGMTAAAYDLNADGVVNVVDLQIVINATQGMCPAPKGQQMNAHDRR